MEIRLVGEEGGWKASSTKNFSIDYVSIDYGTGSLRYPLERLQSKKEFSGYLAPVLFLLALVLVLVRIL